MRFITAFFSSVARGLFSSLGILFAPLGWVLRPFAKLGSFMGLGRLFGKRSAWRTTPLSASSQSLDGGLFKPMFPNTGARAAPLVILRPVNPLFVVFSLLVALCFNVLPWGNWFWVPDAVALCVVFWAYREPRMISLGVAFVLGLVMDVHDGTVLGQHSLAYCLAAYGGVLLSRRLASFGPLTQSLQVWPVLLVSAVLSTAIKVFFGGGFTGWLALIAAPSLGALCWPIVAWLLIAPQRKPLSVDQNRPL